MSTATSLPLEDDKSISDDSQLWRRIPPWHIVDDKNFGRKRISKAAFEDHPDGSAMSVVLGDEVLAAGRQPSSVVAGHAGFCLAAVSAGVARSLKQGISRQPLEDEPAHAEVFGKKTDGVRKGFAKAAVWIIGPDEDSV
ncbi:MAG: hypothetical protein GXY58_16220 [Planctomycetaceae bacterium]|nr:hypothetical protein [Planctomycetaceae bacterium]